MTRRDPLVPDRRLEPLDLVWLREDLTAERAWERMRQGPGLRARVAAWLADGWHHVWLVAVVVVVIWRIGWRA